MPSPVIAKEMAKIFESEPNSSQIPTMPDPKHNSVSSSTYSGHSGSVATATASEQEQRKVVKKVEAQQMMSSAGSAKEKRKQN